MEVIEGINLLGKHETNNEIIIQLDKLHPKMKNQEAQKNQVAKLDAIAKIACGTRFVEKTSGAPSSSEVPQLPLGCGLSRLSLFTSLQLFRPSQDNG